MSKALIERKKLSIWRLYFNLVYITFTDELFLETTFIFITFIFLFLIFFKSIMEIISFRLLLNFLYGSFTLLLNFTFRGITNLLSKSKIFWNKTFYKKSYIFQFLIVHLLISMASTCVFSYAYKFLNYWNLSSELDILFSEDIYTNIDISNEELNIDLLFNTKIILESAINTINDSYGVLESTLISSYLTTNVLFNKNLCLRKMFFCALNPILIINLNYLEEYKYLFFRNKIFIIFFIYFAAKFIILVISFFCSNLLERGFGFIIGLLRENYKISKKELNEVKNFALNYIVYEENLNIGRKIKNMIFSIFFKNILVYFIAISWNLLDLNLVLTLIFFLELLLIITRIFQPTELLSTIGADYYIKNKLYYRQTSEQKLVLVSLLEYCCSFIKIDLPEKIKNFVLNTKYNYKITRLETNFIIQKFLRELGFENETAILFNNFISTEFKPSISEYSYFNRLFSLFFGFFLNFSIRDNQNFESVLKFNKYCIIISAILKKTSENMQAITESKLYLSNLNFRIYNYVFIRLKNFEKPYYINHTIYN